MKSLRHLALAVGLLLAAGCGSSDKPAGATPDGGSPAAPDSGAPPATPDGGAAPDGGGPVPLVVWVDDLMTWEPNRTPDTVEDKNVMDTDDPGAFDMLLAQPAP